MQTKEKSKFSNVVCSVCFEFLPLEKKILLVDGMNASVLVVFVDNIHKYFSLKRTTIMMMIVLMVMILKIKAIIIITTTTTILRVVLDAKVV